MEEIQSNPRVVLGLGNLLCRDEGFGIHALQALQACADIDSDVEFVDGGVLGLRLLPLVETTSFLLVLDAIDAGLAPGTMVELHGDQIRLENSTKLSEHQVSFQEVLGMAHFRGCLPAHMQVLGVQPQDLSAGIDLTPPVEAALPAVLGRAREVIQQWRISR